MAEGLGLHRTLRLEMDMEPMLSEVLTCAIMSIYPKWKRESTPHYMPSRCLEIGIIQNKEQEDKRPISKHRCSGAWFE